LAAVEEAGGMKYLIIHLCFFCGIRVKVLNLVSTQDENAIFHRDSSSVFSLLASDQSFVDYLFFPTLLI